MNRALLSVVIPSLFSSCNTTPYTSLGDLNGIFSPSIWQFKGLHISHGEIGAATILHAPDLQRQSLVAKTREDSLWVRGRGCDPQPLGEEERPGIGKGSCALVACLT